MIGFDERRAHLVEGGADIFLMPSRFEPCGLNQMYSLRYGTVPVVRATGGLVDSVQPWSTRRPGRAPASSSPSTAARRSWPRCATRSAPTRSRPTWKRLQQNGMKQDFSWERSARAYVTVYKGVIAARRGRRQRRTTAPA